MKAAKLPNGKVLKFPDTTPDEYVDAMVREHLKDHTAKVKSQDDKEAKGKAETEGRHADLLQGLSTVAQLLHAIHQQTADGHAAILDQLKDHSDILNEHTKILNKPKRMKVVRGSDGKITNSEEY